MSQKIWQCADIHMKLSGGLLLPGAPPAALRARAHTRQLGCGANCYDCVVVSCNKCNVVVGIYKYDPISTVSSRVKTISLLRLSSLIRPHTVQAKSRLCCDLAWNTKPNKRLKRFCAFIEFLKNGAEPPQAIFHFICTD
jgi:hypothetical protein